VNRKKQINII